MHAVDERISKVIEEHSLLATGDRVLVAVSGGPDSMLLLHWLNRNRHRWQLEVLAAHLNHQFRGSAADEDEHSVEQTCRKMNIPCFTRRMDVAAYARQTGLSKQAAARECRYHYFAQLAQEHDIDKLAVAHHADDQTETVLMRLIRGAGLQGISGMPVKRSTAAYAIIRPLMGVNKEQIEAYCRHYGIRKQIDQSNLTEDYTRNQIRLRLIPEMKKLNPNLHRVVQEMTQVLQEENEFLNEWAHIQAEKVMERKSGNTLTINLSLFRRMAFALQRRVLLLLLNYLPTRKAEWQKIHIDSILHICAQTKNYGQVHLPDDVIAIRDYEHLLLAVRSKEDKRFSNRSERHLSECHLSAEGEYAFGNRVITLEYVPYEAGILSRLQEDGVRDDGTAAAFFDADGLSFPLLVRHKKHGDNMQLLGMNGHKKVKDIFIDEKIPHHRREEWPIVADTEEIIWIPGLRRADKAKVTAATKTVLIIKVSQGRGHPHERGYSGDTDY